MCATGESVKADKWYCDSGASKHIIPNKQYFATYTKFALPEKISLRKQGVVMQAHGLGTINIQLLLNNIWQNAEMKMFCMCLMHIYFL